MTHLIVASGGTLVYETGGHLVKGAISAPSTCPSGLSTTYDISWTGGVSGNGCGYFGPGDYIESPETRTLLGTCYWGFFNLSVSLNTSGTPFWIVSFNTGSPSFCVNNWIGAKKSTGLTPVGSYVVTSRRIIGDCLDPTRCLVNTIDNIVVAESAP